MACVPPKKRHHIGGFTPSVPPIKKTLYMVHPIDKIYKNSVYYKKREGIIMPAAKKTAKKTTAKKTTKKTAKKAKK